MLTNVLPYQICDRRYEGCPNGVMDHKPSLSFILISCKDLHLPLARINCFKFPSSRMHLDKMLALTLAMILAVANAVYFSSQSIVTSPPSVNDTKTRMLLPRQDGGGEVTIYADGKFVDDKYGSLFACVPKATSEPAPPPPPPSSTEPPPPPPSPTPSVLGSGATCNTIKGVVDTELERGAEITNFDKEDMRKLCSGMCHGSNRYPLTKHQDYKDKVKNANVRLVCDARSSGATNAAKFDEKICVVAFDGILNFCKCFQYASIEHVKMTDSLNVGSDYGGETTRDDVKTTFKAYAFTLPK